MTRHLALPTVAQAPPETWRGHSCLPRRHSCRRFLVATNAASRSASTRLLSTLFERPTGFRVNSSDAPPEKRRDESRRGRHECLRHIASAFLLLSLPLHAAVTGTVINRTTGKPQAGATVGFNKLGQNGIELIDQAKSDANGKFVINQEVSGPPHLLRTAYDGVTYNHMLPPGSPTTDLTIDVYNSSKDPGRAKVTKHMLLFEPSGGQMTVNETYLYTNDGKVAWNDSDGGTLHFFAPNVTGRVTANATAPGGMPIPAPVNKTSKSDIYAVDFSVKPGETRFDLTYTVPYTEGAPYKGKILTQDGDTYLIAPNGITLQGDGLKDMGTEPRTQAHIFGLNGTSYQIQLTGTEAAAPADASGGGDQAESGGPQIEQILPRVNRMTVGILSLALGILALGFTLLYRANPAGTLKESNERGRR
ncbi:MAG TPA: hypothetical protein VMH81_39090 [Bryobacteraceae bacterium]|nr:hypothetical protein [Bryobacteraceae bacterium]